MLKLILTFIFIINFVNALSVPEFSFDPVTCTQLSDNSTSDVTFGNQQICAIAPMNIKDIYLSGEPRGFSLVCPYSDMIITNITSLFFAKYNTVADKPSNCSISGGKINQTSSCKSFSPILINYYKSLCIGKDSCHIDTDLSDVLSLLKTFFTCKPFNNVFWSVAFTCALQPTALNKCKMYDTFCPGNFDTTSGALTWKNNNNWLEITTRNEIPVIGSTVDACHGFVNPNQDCLPINSTVLGFFNNFCCAPLQNFTVRFEYTIIGGLYNNSEKIQFILDGKVVHEHFLNSSYPGLYKTEFNVGVGYFLLSNVSGGDHKLIIRQRNFTSGSNTTVYIRDLLLNSDNSDAVCVTEDYCPHPTKRPKPTRSPRHTKSPRHSKSRTPHHSQSRTPHHSQSKTPHHTQSKTPHHTQSKTPHHTQSKTPHHTQSKTNEKTKSKTESQSFSQSKSKTNVKTKSMSQINTESFQQTNSIINSQSKSISQSNSNSNSYSGTQSNTKSQHQSISQTNINTNTFSQSNSFIKSESNINTKTLSNTLSNSKISNSKTNSPFKSYSQSLSLSMSNSVSKTTHSVTNTLSKSYSQSLSLSMSDSASKTTKSVTNSPYKSYSQSMSLSTSESNSKITDSASSSPFKTHSDSRSLSMSNSISNVNSNTNSRSLSLTLSHSNNNHSITSFVDQTDSMSRSFSKSNLLQTPDPTKSMSFSNSKSKSPSATESPISMSPSLSPTPKPSSCVNRKISRKKRKNTR